MSERRTIHAKPATRVITASPVDRRSVAEDLSYHPRTELGKTLWDLRQKIVASGEPLLDADEIDSEVGRRRGGVMP